MRILLLKHRRAGGFCLSQWIANELQLHHYHEPFAEEQPFNRHNAERALYSDNVLVEEIPESIKEFGIDYESYLGTFEKIVCLTRKDLRECAISMQTFIQKDKVKQYNVITKNWLGLNEEEFKLNEEYLKKSKLDVLNVTNGIQVTYEDIFETKKDILKLANYLEINNLKYEHLLNLIDPVAIKFKKIELTKLI